MSALSQQELQKIRKTALESVTLTNDMKSTAIEEKLRSLNGSVKKLLAKKGATIEIFAMKGND